MSSYETGLKKNKWKESEKKKRACHECKPVATPVNTQGLMTAKKKGLREWLSSRGAGAGFRYVVAIRPGKGTEWPSKRDLEMRKRISRIKQETTRRLEEEIEKKKVPAAKIKYLTTDEEDKSCRFSPKVEVEKTAMRKGSITQEGKVTPIGLKRADQGGKRKKERPSTIPDGNRRKLRALAAG